MYMQEFNQLQMLENQLEFTKQNYVIHFVPFKCLFVYWITFLKLNRLTSNLAQLEVTKSYVGGLSIFKKFGVTIT